LLLVLDGTRAAMSSPGALIAVTALELLGAPSFVLWQHRVATRAM